MHSAEHVPSAANPVCCSQDAVLYGLSCCRHQSLLGTSLPLLRFPAPLAVSKLSLFALSAILHQRYRFLTSARHCKC